MSLFAYLMLSAVLFLGMVALQVIGFRIARSERFAGMSRLGLGFVEAAVFGLLGLLLAFQFNRAASQITTWRTLIVREGRAIATSYQRLDLLSPERRPALQEMFRRYTDARISYYEEPNFYEAQNSKEAEAAVRLQTEIWSLASAAALQEPSSAATNLLLSSLNEMFDMAAARKVASATHVPAPVLALLFSVALMSALLAGYAMSSDKKQSWLHVLVFSTVVVLTIFIALDMEYPRNGMIRIGAADQTLVDARRAMD
jgi:hypothetical protein